MKLIVLFGSLFPALVLPLNCYSTVHQVTPISIKSSPIEVLNCDLLMDSNDNTGQLESLAKLKRTDEENYKNLPACYTSCSGQSLDTATCTYSCARQESCLLLKQISDKLQSISQVEATTGAACPGSILKSCQPKYYFHRCCMDSDLCNRSKASTSSPTRFTVLIALALVFSISLQPKLWV